MLFVESLRTSMRNRTNFPQPKRTESQSAYNQDKRDWLMMSAQVQDATYGHVRRNPAFYETTIGKKFVMAVSGAVLYLYILAHLAGNLLIYGGREAINNYVRLLHARPSLLWTARVILLAAVIVHIVTSLELWWLKHVARPIGYMRKKDVPPAYASGTMMWSGPIIAGFVIFHVLHLTTGSLGLPFHELDAYGNLVGGFRIPWVAVIYVIAMTFLAMHVHHGFWSLFQSLGISHPPLNRKLKFLAHALAIAIGAGFISIPVMVFIGAVH